VAKRALVLISGGNRHSATASHAKSGR